MSDDKSKKRPLDAFKINVHEDYELRYWSKTLKVSPDELKEAVSKVGPQASRVRQFLKKD
jgi:hypothetical protein